jgi:hypothetical protein
LVLLFSVAICNAQYGSGQGSYGTIGKSTSGGVTNQYQVGNIFYVSTNGNDATAVIGNPSKPWSGTNLCVSSGVTGIATNWGDIIYLEPGYYYPTGEIYLGGKGVTLTGVKSSRNLVWLVQTNPPGESTAISERCMIVPKDSDVICNLTWTNSTSTPTRFGPFMGTSMGAGNGLTNGGISFTNVLLDNLSLNGAFDVFFGSGNNVSTNYFTIQNSYILGYGDVLAMQYNVGAIISINNEWVNGQNLNACVTCPMFDTGSYIHGVSSSAYTPGISPFGFINFNGTRFSGTPQTILDAWCNDTNYFNSGNYINVDNGIVHIVGTKSTATPYTNSGCYYQISVFGTGAPDAGANGTYTLASSQGDIVNQQVGVFNYTAAVATYTNSSAYVVHLNYPQSVILQNFGLGVWSIDKTNGQYGLYADFTPLVVPTNTASIVTNTMSSYNGTGTPGKYYFTTNIVPANQAIFFTKSYYNGAITLDQNQKPALAGAGVSISSTNRLSFTTVSSLTNTLGRDATAIVTAGTSVILQDTNGTAIATIGTVATLDVLIPMHINMRLAGTGVSAILY